MTQTAPCGVIDVGSHSVLLLVARTERDGGLTILSERAEITRLGEGLDRSDILNENAIERTLRVMEDYKEDCNRLGADRILAIGTSAMRRATNARTLQNRALDLLGIRIRVIEGTEEARLTFLSVAAGMPEVGPGYMVIDIGGGSTEFVAGRGRTFLEKTSLNLGAVGLTERYLLSDPPASDEYHNLSEAVAEALEGLPDLEGIEILIGIAGTVTTLAAIDKGMETYEAHRIEGMHLSLSVIDKQIRMFRDLPLDERKKIPGLRPERAEVILAGAEILRRSMMRYNLGEVRVSTKGVRYGILFEELNRALKTDEVQKG